jgi:hypothetical protein
MKTKAQTGRIDRRAASWSLSSEDFAGAPLVVAFGTSWSSGRERLETLDALRAELRGLGASLIVVTPDEASWVDPYEEVERRPASQVKLTGTLGRLARAPRERSTLELFALDAGGAVRFARSRTGVIWLGEALRESLVPAILSVAPPAQPDELHEPDRVGQGDDSGTIESAIRFALDHLL